LSLKQDIVLARTPVNRPTRTRPEPARPRRRMTADSDGQS
jgi:hypothetical protein